MGATVLLLLALPLSLLLPTLLLSPLWLTLPLSLSPTLLPLLLLPTLPLSLWLTLLPSPLWPQLLPPLSTTSLLWLLSPLPPSTRLCRPTSFPRPVWADTRFTIRFITSPRLLWTPGPPPTPPTTSSTTPLSSEPVLSELVLLEPVLLELTTVWVTPDTVLLELSPPLLPINKENSHESTTKELLSSCGNINNTMSLRASS